MQGAMQSLEGDNSCEMGAESVQKGCRKGAERVQKVVFHLQKGCRKVQKGHVHLQKGLQKGAERSAERCRKVTFLQKRGAFCKIVGGLVLCRRVAGDQGGGGGLGYCPTTPQYVCLSSVTLGGKVIKCAERVLSAQDFLRSTPCV